MLLINDCHIGHVRKGGTTEWSRSGLRCYLLDRFKRIFVSNAREHIVVVGDLFDDFTIDLRDWWDTFEICYQFLDAGGRLTLVAGNHDAAARADKVSSFHVLCRVLMAQFPNNFRMVDLDEVALIDNVYMVGHHTSQHKFDEALNALLLDARDRPVLLHANFDNNFVAESDHSLNVSRDMARAFLARNCRPIFAHEHQHRELKLRQLEAPTVNDVDSVYVLGNQWPTSIADCLGNDEKYAYTLEGQMLLPFTTWSRSEEQVGYLEVDWRHLDEIAIAPGFIRVTGEAGAAEASTMINAIAQFRQHSDAFVISNVVKVDGISQKEGMVETAEEIHRFDIVEYIRSQLDDEQRATFDRLEALQC